MKMLVKSPHKHQKREKCSKMERIMFLCQTAERQVNNFPLRQIRKNLRNMLAYTLKATTDVDMLTFCILSRKISGSTPCPPSSPLSKGPGHVGVARAASALSLGGKLRPDDSADGMLNWGGAVSLSERVKESHLAQLA